MIDNKESLVLPLYEENNTVPQSMESYNEIALDNEGQFFDLLYDAMLKCKRNVMWKPSVKRFVLKGIKNIGKLKKELLNGTYRPRPPKTMMVYYPKRRRIFANSFRDRIVQTYLVDNFCTPLIGKSFVYGNVASQKGKGTDKALELAEKYLWREYCSNGTDYYILQIDIKKYYESIPLKGALELFREKLPHAVYKIVELILKSQYQNGFFAGSQIIQFLGVSYLNKLDHFIKEELQIKSYIRYQDDFFLLCYDRDYLTFCLEEIKKELAGLGLMVNEKKTKITKITEGFRFLGFDWHISPQGNIYKFTNPQRIKHERYLIRKLSKLLAKEELLIQMQSFLSYLDKSDSRQAKTKLLSYIDTIYSKREALATSLLSCHNFSNFFKHIFSYMFIFYS